MDGISLFSSKPRRKPRAAPEADAPGPRRDRDAEDGAAALNAGAETDAGLTAVDDDAAPQQAGEGAADGDDEVPTFRQLGLSEWLDAVCQGLGMREPTVVQRGCIPAVLAGRDVLGIAHTGSGKTAAFALPILQHLARDPYGVFALVLTPTRSVGSRAAGSPLPGHPACSQALQPRGAPWAAPITPLLLLTRRPHPPHPRRELAFQLADQFRALGAGMSLRECVVVGGLDMQAQATELARRPHVVIATPGRLKVSNEGRRAGAAPCWSPLACPLETAPLLALPLREPPQPPNRRHCPHPRTTILHQGLMDEDGSLAKALSRVRYLVLDEADRLLEPSFAAELETILGALPPARQTLLFSATTTRALGALGASLMRDAYRFAAYEGLETAERLTQQYLFIPAKVKEVYLVHLLEGLEAAGVRSAIIFASTCRGAHLLSTLLEELGLPAAALHSLKPQRARLAALQRFKGGGVPVLVATDVASRGLDIPTVDLVINYDLPRLARDYVHR